MAKSWTGLRLSLSLCYDGYPSTNKLCKKQKYRDGSRRLPGVESLGHLSRAISASVENIQLLSRVVQAIHLPLAMCKSSCFSTFLPPFGVIRRQCLRTAGCEVGSPCLCFPDGWCGQACPQVFTVCWAPSRLNCLFLCFVHFSIGSFSFFWRVH